MTNDPTPVQVGSIRSEFVSFPNRAEVPIAAYLDRPQTCVSAGHWVVVAPKYGETKKNSLQTAYYLAANGLNVLRFDHTNHVGESGGDKTFFTLADAVGDLQSVLDFLEREQGATSVTVVANSLSARTAIRATALDPRVTSLVCLVGVVNLRHTLAEIYRDDLVAGHQQGRRWGVGDMLGVEMDYDYFLRSAVHTAMHELAGTRADLERARARVTLFAAENDHWVKLEDVRAAAAGLGHVEVRVIPGAMHELRESAEAAEQAFRDLVATCLAAAAPGADPAVRPPDKQELMRQNRAERDQLRRSLAQTASEREFWSDYLNRYQLMRDVTDFQQYLDLVARLLGPLRPGEIVLDAGCGNGLFGLWTLHELVARAKGRMDPPPVYVGLDLTTRGLQLAMGEHVRFVREAARRYGGAVPPGLAYAQTNLDTWSRPDVDMAETLRFADRTFDKICCSLVLSYLDQPAALVRQLRRVLKPGGRIVVSSMKPFCDMSEIYRDFMDQQLTEEDLESGRDLLRAAGRIRLKEEHGQYQFFSAEEMAAMLADAGFTECAGHLSLGGQAAVVVASA